MTVSVLYTRLVETNESGLLTYAIQTIDVVSVKKRNQFSR